MNVRAHILVSGRVQGVFFRVSAAQKAKQRGLTGWVMNVPDGRVEVVVEGEKGMVDRIVAFCKQGPRGPRSKRSASSGNLILEASRDLRRGSNLGSV